MTEAIDRVMAGARRPMNWCFVKHHEADPPSGAMLRFTLAMDGSVENAEFVLVDKVVKPTPRQDCLLMLVRRLTPCISRRSCFRRRGLRRGARRRRTLCETRLESCAIHPRGRLCRSTPIGRGFVRDRSRRRSVNLQRGRPRGFGNVRSRRGPPKFDPRRV
jgi:hypothetical protein